MDYKEEIARLNEEIKAQGYEAICFWLPAYNTGGGPYYLCEIAKYLTANTYFKVYYMDYPEGRPHHLLEGSDVEMLDFSEEDSIFPVKEKCIVVTNSTRVIQLTRMRLDNKLLFWHYETVPCTWDIVLIMKEAKAFLELCRQKKAMVFHDWSAWDILSLDCGREYGKTYLSLYLPPKIDEARPGLINDNEINIVWLGRLVHEKVFSVYNLVDKLLGYKSKRKKILHIVGEGVKEQEVRNYCKKYSNQIKFDFAGTIPKNKLDQYLINHADIVFGMGLSALEGAALKIPSVVVLLDTKPIKGNDFIWLFNSKDYCCGILPAQKERYDVTYNNIWDILDTLYIYEEKDSYGQKCYEYFMENHSSMELIIYQFLSALAQDELTMKDLEACIKYIPYSHVCLRKRYLFGKQIGQRVLFEAEEKQHE